MISQTNNHLMQQALVLAEQGRYTVSPNPMVGCIVVRSDKIVGQGYHQHAGGAHAEIIALEQAQQQANGATLIVTLEPCCHYGRTPPCTDAIIRAGIKKIVIACQDPNPLVAGKGIAALQQAGIQVQYGILEKEANQLNCFYNYFIQHKRPFVIAKWAMSLDGKTITHPDDNRQITHAETQKHLHQLRQQVDAILIGRRTAITDNPLLTVRNLGAEPIHKQPMRIILASRGHLPLHLKLLNPRLPGKTLVALTNQADPQWINQLHQQKITTLLIKADHQGHISLPHLLDALGQREITSLLVEGGMTVHQQFFQENLVNNIHVYIAPVFIGNAPCKKPLANFSMTASGPDLCLTTTLLETDYV
ncbi:MAG TPA: bifunctional diaminohydroxyphosphoribosylaminopyrimidine deaminase/5-amino-6-(5-phosphoribosylamino)uracil reductase RibD [Gammaproteobacteria bacterium]|nr:bifunctional diaminohydroxyphosphoribosylaminopyrimidine deaminase/5-amino-6-(5-phosphoribosylamino)uracil reductase RibD [Gammaproteobacteria bacterium]